MDRITSPTSLTRWSSHSRALQPSLGHAPAALAAAAGHKSSFDYARALKRRFWLALAVAVVVIAAGSVYVLRMPDIYLTTAEVKINPPQYNPVLASMFGSDMRSREADVNTKYIPTMLASLRGKSVPARVAEDPTLSAAGGDVAVELGQNLLARQLPNTEYVQLTLEGPNPARITKVLNAVVKVMRDNAQHEVDEHLQEAQNHATTSLNSLKNELKNIDDQILLSIKTKRHIGPDGKSLIALEYTDKHAQMMQELANLNQIRHQALLLQYHVSANGTASSSPVDAQIAQLSATKQKLEGLLLEVKEIARNFETDPAALRYSKRLKTVLDQLEGLKAIKRREPRAAELLVQHAEQAVNDADVECGKLLRRLQDSMPDYQSYQTLIKEYDESSKRYSNFRAQNSNFEMLAKTQKEPVTVLTSAAEPTVPVRPKRSLLIAIISVVGCLLGAGLVIGLEALDHRVKQPEHVTLGLGLPLLGVVPRARRVAELVRGGHIWTAATPQSVEADAYRNLRAGLLGLEGPRGPVVTILVTSAKAGEGKSTTALNLAATCARAGERTLLVDCDLRRPSLGDVFGEGKTHRHGLVDVIQGVFPWQRTVVRSDIPNLDFLPTGETVDVPIEILGTFELKQLIRALSNHYDRVILDGPAILGMADCRTLGMYVDKAILVVRAGAHDLGPLLRAKAMLDQSRIEIAGAVFNGLNEDLGNWSSVSGLRGYAYGYGYSRPSSRQPARAGELGNASDNSRTAGFDPQAETKMAESVGA